MKPYLHHLRYYKNVTKVIYRNKFLTFTNVSIFALAMFSLIIQGYRIFKFNGVPFTTPDTESYFNLKFLSAQRPPLVPLIYSTLEKPLLIVGFQCLLSTFSYLFFYKVLLCLSGSRKILNYLILVGFTFFLASSPTFEHNFFLMSESIAISTSTLLISSFFQFLLNKSKLNAYLACTFYILWLFPKQAHIIFGLPVLFLLIITIAPIFSRKVIAAIGSSLMGITFYAYVFLFSDRSTSLYNVIQVIGARICRNPEWCSALIHDGMPASTMRLIGDNPRYQPNVNAVLENSELNAYFLDHGMNLLANFAMEHPMYLFFGAVALPLLSRQFDYTETIFAPLSYGSHTLQYLGDYSQPVYLYFWWANSLKWIIFPIVLLMILLLKYVTLAVHKKELIKNNQIIQYTMIFMMLNLARSIFDWNLAGGDFPRLLIDQAINLRLIVFVAIVELFRHQKIEKSQ